MIEFVEYRMLERSKTLQTYIDYYKEHGIEKFISAVKHTGVTLHPYPGINRYARLISDITESICNKEDKECWLRILNESSILNSLYVDLYSSDSYVSANSIEEASCVSAFLVALELYLSDLAKRMQSSEKDKENISKENHEERSLTALHKVLEIFDWVSQTASSVLAYLLYFKASTIMSKTKIEEYDIERSFEHFSCIDRKELLDLITKEWQFNCREIFYGDNGEVYVNYVDEFYLDFYISELRKDHRKQSFYTGFAWVEKQMKQVDPNNQHNAGKSREIILAEEYLKLYFCTEDIDSSLKAQLTDTSDEISIVDYLKVYSILIDTTATFIRKNQKYDTCDLNDTCMQINIDALKHDAIMLGVSEESYNKIFATLLFNKEYDSYDCPLIQIDGNYFVVPTIVSNAEIAQVLLSRFRQYDFRGKLFENALIKLLNDNGIFATSYEMNENGINYQCDLLFAISNDIYICECKSWGEDRNIRGYYDQYEKRLKAKEQLDRIADRLIEDKAKLMELLGLKKIRNIERIVILNNAIGIFRKIGSTYFSDYSSLSRFIERQTPGFKFFDENQLVSFSNNRYFEYKGAITYNKFMTFLNNPRPVEIMSNNITKFIKSIDINKLVIHIEQYKKKKDLFAGGNDINEGFLKEALDLLK